MRTSGSGWRCGCGATDFPSARTARTTRSIDGRPHHASLYFDVSGEWCSGDSGTQITWDEVAHTSAGVSLISLTSTPAAPQPLHEINETAEGQGVHPGTDGVNLVDISDRSKLDALVATGAAEYHDSSSGAVVKLIGSPVDEDDDDSDLDAA